MDRYNNGKIYTIRSPSTNKYYIGSTCVTLPQRLYKHKINYQEFLKDKYGFCSSYDIIKYNDCYIELLELYPCKSKLELQKKEGEFIRQNLDYIVNKRINGRNQKQYRDDNKDYIKQKDKDYREANKDIIKQRGIKWREANKDIIVKKKKQYRDENKDILNIKGREYYYKNREKILDKIKTSCVCDCGVSYTISHKSRHEKSKKHQDFLNI